MSKFQDILHLNQKLLSTLAEKQEPPYQSVQELIASIILSSREITYLEDREELRQILRFWGSFLSIRNEEFPDIDIDHPSRRPEIISSRVIASQHDETPKTKVEPRNTREVVHTPEVNEVAAGRVWYFSHTVGRNTASGNGFLTPIDLALAPSRIAYVVNRGNENNFGSRVSKVFIGEPGEEVLLAEFARFGSDEGQAVWPSSVALDSQGHVYLSDDWLNRISVFDGEGNFIKSWGTSGSGQGELSGPAGLDFDQNDNLYVVDSRNHRVQVFSKDGNFKSSFGSHGSGPGEFDSPWGITVDAAGAVYVADWKNNRVQKFGSDGAFQMQFGSAGELNQPSDVAVDPDGDVYVSDWANHRVRVYDPEGEALGSLVGNPRGVAFDAEQSRLIVTDHQQGCLQIYIKDYIASQFELMGSGLRNFRYGDR